MDGVDGTATVLGECRCRGLRLQLRILQLTALDSDGLFFVLEFFRLGRSDHAIAIDELIDWIRLGD